MPDISIGSYYFALLIIAVPLVMHSVPKAMKRYVFLFINVAVFLLTTRDVRSLTVSVVWILLPFFISHFLTGRKWLQRLYYTAVIAIYAYLMGYGHASPVRIVGLSYFLFREIDFSMQYEYVSSEESKAAISFTDYLNYVLSFYTLLAGPIERYEDFYLDFYSSTKVKIEDPLPLIKRIADGYFKVYFISALLKWGADIWFKKLSETDTVLKAVIIFFIFAVLNAWYIYFNFSGYCDVVIAAAALSGIHVHENFNRPYFARSVVEFWNRHHITLSEWIRDYIYSPVMKFLISHPFRHALFAGQCIALFITFLIAGIWHGTNMNYVAYGLLQGLGIVLSSLYTHTLRKHLGKKGFAGYEARRSVKVIENVVTLIYICLTFSFVGYDVIGMVKGIIS